MKIIVLDLDGVLTNRRTAYSHFDNECVDRLNQVLIQTNSHVIISSTFRLNKNLDQVREFCSNGIMYPTESSQRFLPQPKFLADRIIDVTPDIPKYTKKGQLVRGVNRGLEISIWLRDNMDKYFVTEYLVIDDEPAFIKDHTSRLVNVDTLKGFSASNALNAITMLS